MHLDAHTHISKNHIPLNLGLRQLWLDNLSHVRIHSSDMLHTSADSSGRLTGNQPCPQNSCVTSGFSHHLLLFRLVQNPVDPDPHPLKPSVRPCSPQASVSFQPACLFGLRKMGAASWSSPIINHTTPFHSDSHADASARPQVGPSRDGGAGTCYLKDFRQIGCRVRIKKLLYSSPAPLVSHTTETKTPQILKLQCCYLNYFSDYKSEYN